MVKLAEISVTSVHELSDNSRRLGQWVSDNIDHVNDIGAMLEGLQDFNLSSDLVLLDCGAKDKGLVSMQSNKQQEAGKQKWRKLKAYLA